MQAALEALESTYFTLQSEIDTLDDACQTQSQRDTMSAQYVQARVNYWGCVNKAFHDDDPEVVALTNAVDSANQLLTKSVQQLADISKVINDITNVVSIGAKLAAKVIAV